MNPEMAMVMKRNEEREALRSVIQQWNANRLDLFELSEPNENLEFHGVMRFYFQDSGQKVATKCIRVASDATAQDVVETLIEKFRPDMRMLSLPEYALFEIHENGEERKLAMDEKPLLVQLNWHKDDREGRFLLRRLDDKTNMPSNTFQQDGSSFRRKLSKREKKQLKKQEKLNRLKSTGVNDENDARVAEKLYTELPETSFTRSISNPEAVMRRRRQQQKEKLEQFRSKEGGPDTGGTLKIYGESLCRDVPYKTLLLSIRDTAQQVVREMLIKYGLEKEDPHNYCLVQVNGCNEYSKENNHQNNISNNNSSLNNQEYILDDDECPLIILMNHPHSQGSIMFHVRRRPADYHPRKRKKKPQQKWNQHQSSSNELLEYRYEDGLDRLPLFLELNPDGSEICGGAAKRHRLHPNVTEVGCERNSSQSQSQYLQLFGPNILPRHCVIANTEGIVTVTPCSRDSETYVNGQRIYETTILRHGSIVKFGRIHCFRFLDPYFQDRIRQRQDSLRNIHEYTTYDRQSKRDDSSSQVTACAETRRNSSTQNADSQISHNFETTFDVEGNIETRSTSSQGNKEDSRSQRSIGSGSKEGNRIPSVAYQRQGTDAILPAVLEIKEETEETLLNEIITSLDPNTPSFKLAPAYCLYLMARYRASTHYRPELTPTERAHRLTLMLARVANIIQKVIQERYCDIKSLALWLANSSELLFFLQFDRHLFAFSKDARRMLGESVQISFRHLVGCVQSELSTVMPLFFADKDDTSHDLEESPTVLGVLGSAMALLRRYRVNVALTVQLFSHLFHFINVWAFNRLIAPNTNYCSRLWGLRLKARLAQIEVWAERQGLEISTDTHLAKIVQAAHLLQAPKYNADDLASLSSTCFLLNSLQLRALLMKYQPALDEPPLPREHIENVVKIAENLADELARSDGRDVKLEEDPEFALEFVLPIDSYSCEVVRGIPPGLIEFVNPLQNMGLCRLSTQPTSNGLWTVYMELPNIKGAMMRSPSAMSNRSVGYLPGAQEPELQIIKLHKSNNGMGLSIVAAKGAGQDKLGIYIKSVVKGGAADADGRLLAGDQLLKVDGQSLVGITQEKAAEYLVRTGPIVTLEVAKQGAIYHGLATLLSQPSPVMTRAEKTRPRSELFAEPFREFIPSSVSMINLNQHMPYSDSGVQWNDRLTGVMNSNDSDCAFGGGSVGGKHLNVPRNKHNFQPRYGNFLHPDYALLYPSNVCFEELYSSDGDDDNDNNSKNEENDVLLTNTPMRGILTVTSDNCNRIATTNSTTTACLFPRSSVSFSDHKLCLCEDVLQCQRKNEKQSPVKQYNGDIFENRNVLLENGVQRESVSSTISKDAAVKHGITKRIVSDVTSCCLGIVPESDTSVCNEETSAKNGNNIRPVTTNEKSVMTEEALLAKDKSDYFSHDNKILLSMASKFRNSCPLIPPANELCECEKRIFSSSSTTINDQSVVGRVIYDSGRSGLTKENIKMSCIGRPAIPVDSSPFLKDILAFNEQYRNENLKGLIFDRNINSSMFKNISVDNLKTKTMPFAADELTFLPAPSEELSSRRSSSDVNLHQKSSVMAECTKCGNRFDVSGTYFSGPVFEHITSSTMSSLSETSPSSSSSSPSASRSTSTSENRNKSRTDMCDKDRKLTKDERENILKELEEIISGDFFTKMSSFSHGATIGRMADCTNTNASFSSSLFHLDLKALKGSDTSISECSSVGAQNARSIAIADSCYRLGRVAELTKHFSELGEAGIIRSHPLKTKSVPNISKYVGSVNLIEFGGCDAPRSLSTEALMSTTSPTSQSREQDVLKQLDDEKIRKHLSDDSTLSNIECSKRRQSFARQNTVFCKMKSVDELEAKKQTNKCKLYKYASLADFRVLDKVDNDELVEIEPRKKGVSFDDLNVELSPEKNEPIFVENTGTDKKFCLEKFMLSNRPNEENLKINYDKMTSAIRDYLANKELLLKRMKSNSIDNFGVKHQPLSHISRTCPNFTSVHIDEDIEQEKPKREVIFKSGHSIDALYARIGSPLSTTANGSDEIDDFVFKDNIRRVYKDSNFKGRRFRKCRKLNSRRSVLMVPSEHLSKIRAQVNGDLKRAQKVQCRCQSLDTGIEESLGRSNEGGGNEEQSRKL